MEGEAVWRFYFVLRFRGRGREGMYGVWGLF